MGAITWVISLLGVGYAIALTLLIVGCVEDDKYWGLFMLAPYMFTPTMTISGSNLRFSSSQCPPYPHLQCHLCFGAIVPLRVSVWDIYWEHPSHCMPSWAEQCILRLQIRMHFDDDTLLHSFLSRIRKKTCSINSHSKRIIIDSADARTFIVGSSPLNFWLNHAICSLFVWC